MARDTGRVSVSTGKDLAWPHVCVQCLGKAVKEGFAIIGSKGMPYCEDCYDKVQRLTNWKDGIFMISLFIGAIAAVIGLILKGAQEGWAEILKPQNWLIAGAAGMIFMGIFYGLGWILLLPLRAIFHSKVSDPGVKLLKSKDPLVTKLKFSNVRYADLFRQANALALL